MRRLEPRLFLAAGECGQGATATAIPVLFVHGLWLHASSCTPWFDLFEQAGYAPGAPGAPGWPREPDSAAAACAHPDSVAGLSIDEVVAHHRTIAEGLPRPPILIGHSFGGLVVEKMLGSGPGRAAIAIDPAQIKGVLRPPLAQLLHLAIFRSHGFVERDAEAPGAGA